MASREMEHNDILQPSFTLVNDITNVTPSGSAWYSAAHTTLDKGLYIIVGTLQMSNDSAPALGRMYSSIFVGCTINSSTKVISDGNSYGNVDCIVGSGLEVPMTAIVEITEDNTIVSLGGYFSQSGTNRFGARKLQVLKLG